MESSNHPKGMAAIQPLLLAAKGGDARSASGALSWAEIAERISQMPGAPVGLDAMRVRRIFCRMVTLPDDGTELRYVLAALDVPLLDAYRAAGHFPDLRWNGLSAYQRLVEVARGTGVPIRAVGTSGTRIAIEFVRGGAPCP